MNFFVFSLSQKWCLESWDSNTEASLWKNGQCVWRLKAELENFRKQGVPIETYYRKLTKLSQILTTDYQQIKVLKEIKINEKMIEFGVCQTLGEKYLLQNKRFGYRLMLLVHQSYSKSTWNISMLSKLLFDIISECCLLEVKPKSFPLEQNHKLLQDDSTAMDEPYRSRHLIGHLIYWTIRRELSYVIHEIS